MAGRDIVLKIGADIREAISGFAQVRKESEDTARTLDSTTAKVERLATRIRTTQIGQGLRTFGTSLAGGAGLGEAALGGLSTAFPEFAVLETSINVASSMADRLQHTAEKLEAAQRRLGEPESTADVIAGFRATVEERTRATSLRETFRTTFDFFTQGGTGNRIERGRERRRQFRDLARSRPGDALLVLADSGNDPELAKIYEEETRHAAATHAYRAAQSGQVAVTNVYTAFDGLGGRSAIGRQVRSTLDARDRNNGRYVNTAARR